MKILMFAHGGSFNRGCEAIVRSSANILKETNPDTKVFLVSDFPESDEDIPLLDAIYDGSSSEIRKYSPEWLLSSIQVKITKNESYALGKIYKNVIKHINEADVCLSIGGDNYCYGEQPAWYEIDHRVKKKGKKLVLWACSIGEEDLSERKLKDLQHFDLILTRETLTYTLLKKNGLDQVKLCADPAFTMEKEELPLPKGWQKGNTIGLNYSPLVNNRNPKAANSINELIEYIFQNSNMTVALTPHVIQKGNNDYEILHHIYEKYKETNRIILLPDNLNAIQYKGYISRMRFFIGARTHATIAAYSSHVPTMVLGYSVKSKGIAKDIFGEEKLVLSLEEISETNKLINAFETMVEEEERIKFTLRKQIPNIQKMSYKAAELVNELY